MPVKFQTYKKNVPLAPGQALRFQKGKGYYAGPPAPPTGYAPGGVTYQGPAPRRPPTRTVSPRTPMPAAPAHADPYAALAAPEIDRRAAELANAGLDPQKAEIARQRDRATTQAVADEAAITGFQTAAGALMAKIAPEVGAGYRDAAGTVGAIGTNVGGAVGEDLRAKQASEDAFAASQGQSGGHTLDPTAEGATIGMLGGVIPGESLATQGAAAQERAARDVLIPLNAGREQLAARMAQARTDDDGYAQQLIQLASQFPGLKAQALQQLNQYEIDKANYRETVRVNTANIAAQKRDDKRQDLALEANAKAAGVDIGLKKDAAAYKWASLEFQSAKAKAAAQAEAKKGKRIDTQASKLLGHIVYMDGTENTSIKVKQVAGTKTGENKAKYNRAKATQDARKQAFQYAAAIIGKPKAVDAKTTAAIRAVTPNRVGKYVAASGEKTKGKGAVFPPAYPGAPATTNNPARAEREGAGAESYIDAQTKTWAMIGGDSLMSRFGYSREQVMAIVNRALRAAGWRP